MRKRMNVERHLSRAVTVVLAVAMFAAACSKDKSTTTTAPSCAFSVVQPTTTFGPEGGTGSATVTVTAGTGCTWTATSSATFITFTSGGTGTGSGTAAFTVAANAGAERTSTLTIAGTSVTITQRAAVVTPPPTLAAPTPRSPSGGQDVELRPTLVVNNAVSTGGIGTVTYRFEVSDADSFPNDPARTITQDGIAQGSGTTSWPIPRDLTAGTLYYWRARATNGTITTAFSAVERFRPGTGCTYALSTTSVSVGSNGGSATVNIATTGACSWIAVSNDGFIVLTTPSSGTGSGAITFSLAPNIGAARTGTLTIAGQTVTVSQDALPPNGLVASFQLFDPATQASATTECRFRNGTGQPSTCVLRSTSVPLGTNAIVAQSWNVQYTYLTVKTITGTDPTLSITDTCGQLTSTDDGVAQPLQVTLTVTDSNGVIATATSGSGLQPPLFVRLYTCGL
jgi:Viral BACON domain